ncbi:DEAD/DEAH box helicase [Cohnella sp. WQ 127256]|uniref:preprotein translocase subunit SecA n=1 Tax=Cohnella sp. WQ 127256 TaxID=2938790 RepID=UPI002118F9F0|nr:DEAD/DEAH box helicase [Cohnella sp. WQ 127256]
MGFTENLMKRVRSRSNSNDHLNLIRQYSDPLKHVRDEELSHFVSQLRGTDSIALDDEVRIYRLFAAVKEAVKRVHGFVLHDVQLTGGLRMAQGHIVEMATGEGKTVTLTLPASWYALQNQGVHVMTANAYLAERDYNQMKPVYEMLGLSVGLNLSGMEIEEKKQAYRQDITYGVFNEFGFDYLRDHLVYNGKHRVQRALSYAIVDEADNVLIDEGKTPLIVADLKDTPSEWYTICAELVGNYKIDDDYELDFTAKQVTLTDAGTLRAERFLEIDNLFDLAHANVLHILDQSLQAHYMMNRDADYIVEDQTMKIIDSFTGRVLEGRLFNEGLHQAIEAKERIPLSPENKVLAEISVQQYFSMYERLIGMTGTIKTDEEEVKQRFGLSISIIPTAKPVQRKDERDLIVASRQEKLEAVLREVKACHITGQPVLIGTTTIAQSEVLAERLKEAAIPFRLLNAKNEQEESGIVANAGQYGAITIATNMAGRGTDIRIGEGIAELGGLYVIGTERHESRRIDNQLRGRAGRQGDPGRSRFIVSLEDELILRYTENESERDVNGNRAELLFRQAQLRAENRTKEIRSFLSRIDSIVHEQRQLIYGHRNELWKKGSLIAFLNQHVVEYIQACSPKSMSELQLEQWSHDWKAALQSPRFLQFRPVWHKRYMKMLDRHWISHMERLKDMTWSVQYHSYAQEDPIRVFRHTAYEQFAEMQQHMTRQIGTWMLTEALPNLLHGKRRQAWQTHTG